MDILIIKLGALGDVVRTLPILPAIKKKFPDSQIYWFTKKASAQILENNPYIKQILTEKDIEKNFDILYNFDIDEESTRLAGEIEADKKYGFYYDKGYPTAFNFPSEYYLNTLFDDEFKRNNKKTYQEMMFEAAELPYNKEPIQIYLNEKDIEYAQEFVQKNNINTDKLIGIHMGAGARWPSKAWSEEKIKEFIKKAKEKNYEILLFGGPNETKKHEKMVSELREQNIHIYTNNPENSIKEFISLVDLCKKIVCSDSLALHISIALKKPTIALFFCTPPYEIEGYGILKTLISPMLYEFFPEKMDQYDEKLVNSILIEQVLKALESD